jgi:hypothetical protein
MSRTTHKRVFSLGVVAALAVAAACSDNRSTVLEPQAVQYGFALAPDGRNLPGGTVAYIRPDTGVVAAANAQDTAVVVTLRGLDSLTTKVYQVWFIDTTAAGTDLTRITKATGNLRIIRTDSSINSLGDVVTTQVIRTATGVSSFSNGGPATQVELTVTRATLGSGIAASDTSLLSRAIVLISLEDNAGAATPSAIRPLWARRSAASAEVVTNKPGTIPPAPIFRTATAPIRFGNFGIRASQEYRFVPVGRGRGAIGDDFVVFDDSSLMRPPVGYYYAGVLIKQDATNKPVDTLDLGPQTAPLPRRNVSLIDADVSIPDGVVQATPPSIVAAANRVGVDTIAGFEGNTTPFRGFALAYVTLESKYGVPNSPAPTIVLSGTIPGIVRNGPPTSP